MGHIANQLTKFQRNRNEKRCIQPVLSLLEEGLVPDVQSWAYDYWL